jgi:hypothetical protein
MATIDVKRLAAEISVMHGIRLDSDDPIMAVVTLNQLVFEQSVSVVVDRVASAVRELEQAADKVQARAGVIATILHPRQIGPDSLAQKAPLECRSSAGITSKASHARFASRLTDWRDCGRLGEAVQGAASEAHLDGELWRFKELRSSMTTSEVLNDR